MKAPAFVTENGQSLKIGDRFRLVGVTEVFTVVSLFLAAGFIPSVRGMNDKHQTWARTVDVLKLA